MLKNTTKPHQHGYESWVALTQEAPIDPDLPICDSHHHFWKLPDRQYMLKEFRQDIETGHNVVRTVVIESDSIGLISKPEEIQPVKETQFAQSIAHQNEKEYRGLPKIANGIIGFADLTMETSVARLLEEHLVESNRFRGIRQTATWDKEAGIFSASIPHLLLTPQFRKGFACLNQYGLVFETFLYHTQLMELVDLAKTFPDTTIILDHAGGLLGIGPYAFNKNEVFQTWKDGILSLAACPNVVIKLGGFGTPISGFNWSTRPVPPGSNELAEVMSPYFLLCIEGFGVTRCMFESNFPVDKMSYSYTVIWNAFKRITGKFSLSDRQALFHDNAVRIYRLQ